MLRGHVLGAPPPAWGRDPALGQDQAVGKRAASLHSAGGSAAMRPPAALQSRTSLPGTDESRSPRRGRVPVRTRREAAGRGKIRKHSLKLGTAKVCIVQSFTTKHADLRMFSSWAGSDPGQTVSRRQTAVAHMSAARPKQLTCASARSQDELAFPV